MWGVKCSNPTLATVGASTGEARCQQLLTGGIDLTNITDMTAFRPHGNLEGSCGPRVLISIIRITMLTKSFKQFELRRFTKITSHVILKHNIYFYFNNQNKKERTIVSNKNNINFFVDIGFLYYLYMSFIFSEKVLDARRILTLPAKPLCQTPRFTRSLNLSSCRELSYLLHVYLLHGYNPGQSLDVERDTTDQ